MKNRMRERRISTLNLLLLVCVIVATSTSVAQDKTKLAEGEYTVKAGPGKPDKAGKTLDHWILWQLKDHNLKAEVRLDEPRGTVVQEFLFTPELKPIGYSLSAFLKGEGGEKDEKHTISCSLLPRLIKCKEDEDTVELSIQESQYGFLPGEFYLLDFSWFFTSLIQNPHEDVERPVYSLAESDSGKPRIELDETQKIHFAGPETITLLGKAVQANKYQLKGDLGAVWTYPGNGMVLAVEDSEHSFKWELTKFKSYSSTFMPELQ